MRVVYKFPIEVSIHTSGTKEVSKMMSSILGRKFDMEFQGQYGDIELSLNTKNNEPLDDKALQELQEMLQKQIADNVHIKDVKVTVGVPTRTA